MNYYTTSDLGLIAALALHFRYEDVDDSNPKRVVFRFIETPELMEMVERYFNDDLPVSAYAYHNKIKQIKSRLYSISKGFLYR